MKPLPNPFIFISIPTLIKKNGIKRLFPVKDNLSASFDVGEIKLLKINPAKKAPIIGSIPKIWAKRLIPKITERTKTNCEPSSLFSFLKNQRHAGGNTNNTINKNIKTLIVSFTQNIIFKSPPSALTIIDKTNNAKKFTIIVPPTVIVTASFFDILNLLTRG